MKKILFIFLILYSSPIYQQNNMKTIINTEKAPNPVGPYSQAVKAGNTLYISGQVAIDPLSNTFTRNNCFEIEPKLLDDRFIIYRVFENYFHKKGISKPSKKSIDNILNNLPCTRIFKIKKGYNVISSGYKLTINHIS